MTVLATIEELRARPGDGRDHSDHRPGDGTVDRRILGWRCGGHRPGSRSGSRDVRLRAYGIRCRRANRPKCCGVSQSCSRLRQSDMAQLDSLNTGMPLPQARRNIAAAIEFFRYFSGWCTKINGIAHDVRMSGGLSGLDGVGARIHDQRARRCRRTDHPVERPGFQRRRQTCARHLPQAAAACSSRPRRPRCRRWYSRRSSPKPVCPMASSIWSTATDTQPGKHSSSIQTSTRSPLRGPRRSASSSCRRLPAT